MWLRTPGLFGRESTPALKAAQEWVDPPGEDDARLLGAYNAALWHNDAANDIRIGLNHFEQTYTWLGRRTGMSHSHVSRMLRGEAHPAIWQIEAMYAALPAAHSRLVPEPDAEPRE